MVRQTGYVLLPKYQRGTYNFERRCSPGDIVAHQGPVLIASVKAFNLNVHISRIVNTYFTIYVEVKLNNK